MKKISFILAAILLIAALISCTPAPPATKVTVLSVTPKNLIAPEYGERNQKAESAASGANAFAFALSNKLAAKAGEANMVCSPFSVWLPLAALLNATDVQNKQKLLSVLGSAGISEEDLNTAASRMLYDLTKQREAKWAKENNEAYYNPLKIANAIFVDYKATLKKDFAQAFADYYRGTSFSVDFSDKSAIDEINRWASDNTEGLITDVVSEFDPLTVAAIANAIYYSDRWGWEFNEANTKEDVFYSPAGETKAYYMLREGDDQIYYEDDKVQAMPLRFSSGGGMYIILPKDGDATKLLCEMTLDYYNEIQEDSEYFTGKLLLPRFEIQSDVMELKDVLKDMGVPLFDEELSPLTGGLIEQDVPVWVSSALQKAMIKVDEKGTTAAAVTIIPAPAASEPAPTEPFVINCNKPFVFVLYDNTYDGGNQILFTGIVNKP